MNTSFDITIVGFGPVGHVLAALLGRAGLRVVVLDRQPGLYPLPRIGHLDHEVMRIVQAVTDAEAFEKLAYVCRHYEWLNAGGDTLIHFDWSRKEVSGWHSHYLFYQPDLDALLSEAVAELPDVTVVRGWEAVAIRQHDDHVHATFRERGTGAMQAIRSRYLIGADGANSFVRSAMLMGWEDLGFRADWLVVDYRPNDLDADIPAPPAAQLCDPARPVSIFRRIGHKHCRWEFMLLPGETPETMEKDETIWRLLSRWVKPEDGTLVRSAVYTFRSGLASRWRAGRVLLAGDAAHLMPPFLGQGMGSGFRDAINLAWKLERVLAGRASEALLDTYEEERAPHVSAIIEQAIALGRIICVTDPVEAAQRDQRLLRGEVPPPPPFPTLASRLSVTGSADPLAGSIGPQGLVKWRGDVGRFDDIVGRGWMVLTFDRGIATIVAEQHTPLLSRLRLRIVVFEGEEATDAVHDVEGCYTAFFKDHSLVALIVRPDFYILCAAHDKAQLDQSLIELGAAID